MLEKDSARMGGIFTRVGLLALAGERLLFVYIKIATMAGTSSLQCIR